LTDDLVKDNRQNRVRVAAAGQGQTAILTYEVLAADEARKVSLLQIELGTGRSHQIRVQLASRGWPLWGDRKYGTSDPAVSGAAVRIWRFLPAAFASGIRHGMKFWIFAPRRPIANMVLVPPGSDIISHGGPRFRRLICRSRQAVRRPGPSTEDKHDCPGR
jgi:hypothetical protein